jgi:hypothetical protein
MDKNFHAAGSFGSRIAQHSVLGGSEGVEPTLSSQHFRRSRRVPGTPGLVDKADDASVYSQSAFA